MKYSKEKESQRSIKQNKALHVYFQEISEELNARGIDVQTFLKTGISVPFTPELVKELLWKSVQKIMLQKNRTRDLNMEDDITRIYEVMNRHLSEHPKFKKHIPFPNKKSRDEKSSEIIKEFKVLSLDEEVEKLKTREELRTEVEKGSSFRDRKFRAEK